MSKRLGVSILSADNPALVDFLIDGFQHYVDDVVVGFDERVDPQTLYPIASKASQVFRVRIEKPDDIHHAKWWLASQMNTEWVLFVDTDEVPSYGLSEWLKSFDRDCHLTTSVGFARRWVWPDRKTFLLDEPWRDDPQIRLVRMKENVTRCGRSLHEPVISAGARRIQPQPLYHLDLLLKSEQQREEKVLKYRQADRGDHQIGGIDFNAAYYLPEHRNEILRLGDISGKDVELVHQALHENGLPVKAKDSDVGYLVVTPDQYRVDDSRDIRCKVSVFWAPVAAEPGRQIRIPFLLENIGTQVLAPHTGSSGIAVGYTISPDGQEPKEEHRAPLEVPLAPGDSLILYAHLSSSGSDFTAISFGVVDEGVRWVTNRTIFSIPST